MNRYTLFTAAAIAVAGMGVTGCDDDGTSAVDTGVQTDVDRPVADNAARRIENAGDRAANAADRAGDRAASAVNEAANDARVAGGDVDATNVRGNDANRAMGNETGPGNTAAAPDAEDIKEMLAASTEAFVKTGTLDDLVERFVDADRNRIGRGDDALKAADDVDARAEAFLASWKAKYGKDFDIVDEKVVFNDQMFSIRQSEIGGARTASGSIDASANTARTTDGNADVDVDVKNRTGVDSPDSKAADTNRNDPGRNVASVDVKASHGMPGLQASLIHEFPDAWKLDVPDTLDAQKLKQNVVAHLNYLDQNKAQWPADANEAYRVVAHHMLLAVHDKPVPQGGASR